MPKLYYRFGIRDGFAESKHKGTFSSDDKVATQKQSLRIEEMVGNIQTTLLTFGTHEVNEVKKALKPPPVKDVPPAKDVPLAKDVPPAKDESAKGGDKK